MYADLCCDLKNEALARAYKLQFFLSVHLGVLPPPPPPYQKAGYATVVQWNIAMEYRWYAAGFIKPLFNMKAPLKAKVEL